MADHQHDTSIELEDIGTNDSNNTHIGELIDTRLSRRQVLGGGLGAGAAMVFGTLPLVGCADDDEDNGPAPLPKLGFTAIDKHTDDIVALPEGYSYSVLYALGDPLDDVTAEWAGDGSETGVSYTQRAGDHHDGIQYFGLSATGTWSPKNSSNGLLVMNHENITSVYLHAAGTDTSTEPRPLNDVQKEINAHGVSVVEIQKNIGGEFEVVRGSEFNRRITAQTDMLLSGPVAGSDWVVTKHDASGVHCRGTVNNCANGFTPWGTYLTCEENWAGYFKRSNDTANRTSADNALLSRYGIGTSANGRRWHSVDEVAAAVTDQLYSRWNITAGAAPATAADDYRNEANTMGWVVEIDPFNPDSTPKKRTLLGRMGHEGAWFAPAVPGKPLVVYMGDDSRNEYIYKFVSTQNWSASDVNGGLAAGDKYLDSGKLYVARFNANGTGNWIELGYGVNGLDENNTLFPFDSQAAVLVATRIAADFVGATKMDRPEWGCVNPRNGEIYMTLTNNSSRTATNAANPRVYDADTGSYTSSLNGNVNGHIIRWREDDRSHASTSFAWDIYVFASREAYPAYVNLSFLDDSNDMSSPDGLWFDPRGMLWIQTDDGAYTSPLAADPKATNCMMLAAVPGEGGTLPPTVSNWPDGGSARPRSATIVITRDDGGEIGTL